MSEANQKPLFDLTPTAEQQLMRDTVRRFVQREMSAKQVRDADEAAAPPAGFYERAQDLGFNLVPIAEAYGGLGAERTPIGNTLIAEDLAYGDMSLALGAMSTLAFINTLIDQGSEAQQAKWLPAFADGTFRPAGLAITEPALRANPAAPQTRSQRQGDRYVLSGEKCLVPFGDTAEELLVTATVEGEGVCAFIVPKGTKGVRAERQQLMGLKPLSLCKVTLDGAVVSAEQKLGDSTRAFDMGRVLALSRIGLAALTVGTCSAVLDFVKEYCNERVAFGEPITHRQSVAFMIANIAIELDGLRLLTYRAASRAEQGLPFEREAYLAKLQAVEKGMQIGSDGVQLLGGHGFIRDHMVELYYRNLRGIGVLEGAISV